MLTPLGEAGMSLLPGADNVSSALTSSIGDKPGMYMFPTAGLGPNATAKEKRDAMERMMEEMKTKPSGLLIYKPAGVTFNFPQTLAVEFGINFLEALLIVYLLAQTGLAAFGRRVLSSAWPVSSPRSRRTFPIGTGTVSTPPTPRPTS